MAAIKGEMIAELSLGGISDSKQLRGLAAEWKKEVSSIERQRKLIVTQLIDTVLQDPRFRDNEAIGGKVRELLTTRHYLQDNRSQLQSVRESIDKQTGFRTAVVTLGILLALGICFLTLPLVLGPDKHYLEEFGAKIERSRDGSIYSIDFGSSDEDDINDLDLLDMLEDKSLHASLRHLGLGRTNVTNESLRRLKEFKILSSLDLTRTDINDAGLYYLRELKSLKTLDLFGMSISDAGLEVLEELPNLTSLEIGGFNDHPVGITDASLAYLKDKVSLTRLSLKGEFTNVGLRNLEGLYRLDSLDISLNDFSDEGLYYLRSLTNLRRLDLSYNRHITGEGLRHLRYLKKLEYLDLRHTQVTDAGVAELQKALPNCKIFH